MISDINTNTNDLIIIPGLSIFLGGSLFFVFNNDDNDNDMHDIINLDTVNIAIISFIISMNIFMKSFKSNPFFQKYFTSIFIISLLSLLDIDIDRENVSRIKQVRCYKIIMTSLSMSFLIVVLFNL